VRTLLCGAEQSGAERPDFVFKIQDYEEKKIRLNASGGKNDSALHIHLLVNVT